MFMVLVTAYMCPPLSHVPDSSFYLYCNILQYNCSRYASEEFTVQNHISKSTKCIVHPYNHKTPGIYMDLGKVSTDHTVVLKTSYWDFSPLLNYRCCCVVHYPPNKSAIPNAIAHRTHTDINITGLYHAFFRISPCVKVSNGWSRHLVQGLEDAVLLCLYYQQFSFS